MTGVPRELPDYADALAHTLALVETTGDLERVPLAAAASRVLRVAITSDRDLPPFDRAQMDGYAVRSADVAPGCALPVARTVPAGADAGAALEPGSCVAIATGAPVPAGADAVVPHEETDRGDPVRFDRAIAAGSAIHPRGADARSGQELVAPPVRLAAHHLGLAAAVGCAELAVARRPRAVVLTSGDEVVPVESTPEPHQIRNSNGIQALELLRACGAEPIGHQHLPDDRARTVQAVVGALEAADLVVTIGGISAGDRDHFPGAFDAARVERGVHGARIQPGKPVITGRAPNGALVVALPGNPVSSLACACLFAWPVVRAWLGLPAAPPWRPAELAAPVRPNARRQAFRPAILGADGRITVPAWQGSGDLAHTARTDGLAALPVQAEEVRAGTHVPFLPWP